MRATAWGAIAAAAILAAGPALALERTSRRAVERGEDAWAAAGTCTIRYYNTCTGWIWEWSGWSTGERVGTSFQRCCRQAVLKATRALTYDAARCGWGFTGTIEIFDAAGSECPTSAPIATQPYCPPERTNWNDTVWNVAVPAEFLVRITWGNPPGFTSPTGLASDRPGAGPTGPPGAGTCYPTGRSVRSYHYGTPGSVYCPGVPLNDGVGDVEFVVEAVLSCPVHVQETSWGKIKVLYE